MTSTVRVLGIGGHAESGKDAFAQALAFRAWVRRGMSDPILEWSLAEDPWIRVDPSRDPTEVTTKLGLVEESFIRAGKLLSTVGYVQAKRVTEYRSYLQRIGQDAARAIIGQDVWVDVAKKRLAEDALQGVSTVVTGIRQPNEIRMIRELGGKLLWIARPGTGTLNSHAVENSVSSSDFDEIVYNDGTIGALYLKAAQFDRQYRPEVE